MGDGASRHTYQLMRKAIALLGALLPVFALTAQVNNSSGAGGIQNPGQGGGGGGCPLSGCTYSGAIIGTTSTFAMIDKSGQVYDVRGYGAKVDGSTNDTTAVNSAVSAAASAGGGVVFIPAGTMITQPIQGVSSVGFRGAGTQQTTWKLINSATAVAPSGSGSCSTTASVLIECFTTAWSVSDLTIDGNTSNQTAATSHGIYSSDNGYSPTSKTHPRIERVTIQFARTDGIHIDFGSTGAGIHSHITVYGVLGNGIYAGSYDTQWSDVEVGQSGLRGIWADASSQHFTTVKAWFSGAVTASLGHGFVSTAGLIQCDSCEFQDNQANGLYLDGAANNVFTGLAVNGNNRTSATSGNGVEIFNASTNTVIGDSDGSVDFPPSQLYAVRFDGTSASNIVKLTSKDEVTGLIGGTSTGNNVLVMDVNGTIAGQLTEQNGTFSGPVISSAYVGSISSGTSTYQAMRVGNGLNTWLLTAEGNTGFFGIQDSSSGFFPLEIAEGAPTDSILIGSGGLLKANISGSSTAVTQAISNSTTAPATTAFVQSLVLPYSLTTTAATTDNVTIGGMVSGGHCSLAPTNASAATNIATTYISARTTNQITITHTATSGMTYIGTCTPN